MLKDVAAVSESSVQPGVGAPAAAARPDFQIVPLAGLPIVAVVLALLIAGIAVDTPWPLQFLHVVGGAAWTVIDLFLGFVHRTRSWDGCRSRPASSSRPA